MGPLYLGFQGADGKFPQQLPKGLSWVKANIKTIPKNALIGGWEDNGKRNVYIGRTEAHGGLITGKVIQQWGGMFYPLGHEHKADRFEILVADNSKRLKWVPAGGSEVPKGAIQGGFQGKDPLFIARGQNPAGEPTPGKLHPPHGFFLGWGGEEHHPYEYEVLVCEGVSNVEYTNTVEKTKGSVQQQLPKGTSWVKTDINNIPANAFVGGYEDKGKRDVYIGRAEYFGNLIPGKVIKLWKGMFFPLLGKEVRNQTFEVLVTDNPGVLRWVPASSGQVPKGTVQGGFQDGDPLFIARGKNPAGEPTPGKLHPPYGFFLSWDAKEHHRDEYEVLVCDALSDLPHSETKGSVQQQLPKGTSWVKTDINNIPANAFVGGYEDKGKTDVYIGRAEYFGNLIPGKVIKLWKGMFFPNLGKEVRNQIFEVLVTDNPGVLRWVPASSGQVPKGTVQGGFQDGDPLFIARGKNPAGEPTPGKLHPPYGFFLSWDAKEYHRDEYEVLVCDELSDLPHSETKGSVQQQLPKGTSWVKTDINNIPANAFVGGYEDKGKRDVYIGRAEHFGDLIPGKVIKLWKGMFFPLLGKEVRNQIFEVLVTDNPGVLRWVPASSGQVPKGAVQGGFQDGDPLFIARGKNPAGEPTPGKLHPPHGFFLSWDAKEHHRDEYEVLVCDGLSDLPHSGQGVQASAGFTGRISDAPSDSAGSAGPESDVPSDSAGSPGRASDAPSN